MERSLVDMTLELQNSYSHTAVTVKRGDTLRTLRIRLTDGGRPYPISPETSAVFTAVKPDGTHLYNTCLVEKDYVLYDLTSQTTALPGELKCEIRLYGPNGELLTTAAFDLVVTDTVYADGDESVLSSGEATALTRLMVEATAKILQMQAVLDNEFNHAVIDDSTVGEDAWSGKKIADMFCPAFQTQGVYPTCQPLEGYPLEAVSTIAPKTDGDLWEQITLRLSGKNLYDFKHNISEVAFMNSSGELVQKHGFAIGLPAGTYTVHAEPLPADDVDVHIFCYANDMSGNYINLADFLQSGGTNTWLRQGTRNSATARTFTFDRNVMLYVYQGGIGTTLESAQQRLVRGHNLQIETGAVATPYTPYLGQTYTADFAARPVAEGSYNWVTGLLVAEDGSPYQHDPATGKIEMLVDSAEADKVLRRIPAVSGVNYLGSDCGETYVSGRQDLKTWLTERSQE